MNNVMFYKKTFIIRIFTLLLFQLILNGCNLFTNPAENIELNALFSDNMVLQQKQDIPVWGTSKPGGEVIVKLADQQKSTIVDAFGNWSVLMDPVDAGGPYELILIGKKTITIKNVLVGEVWVCSGQSNMEMELAGSGRINNYEEEIANANYPNIRILTVEKTMADTAQKILNSEGWKICTSENIPSFSAVAYFYGRKLFKDLNVPIGLIQSAWGGTVVEAWTSGGTLKQYPEFVTLIQEIENDNSTTEEKKVSDKKKVEEWPDKIEKILKESGSFNNNFQNSDYKTDNWQKMKLPTLWESKGLELDGIVWFSKNVTVPKSWAGEDLILSLGKINDYDITWFNGKRVGRSTDVAVSRNYIIPSSLVKIGNNKITVQVLDIGNVGGIYGPANQMKLANKEQSISLVGDWNYKIDPSKIDLDNLPEKPTSNTGANRPTVLFNGMINPLLPYGIKGAIWYQGESNAERAYQYRSLFKSLINDWRNAWGIKDLPFIFVQLANYKKVKSKPAEDSWAELREAQCLALELPNTAMAVTIDLGEAKDIHPKNKQDVGKRLALNALAKVYDKDITYSGPIYKSMNINGNKINLTFTNTDNGLKIKGNKDLKGFAIAGKDKKFIWAKAKINNDTIVVWNSKIKNPVAVRYAWAANPICNLYNGADLPASPFRTDNWKGITYGKK